MPWVNTGHDTKLDTEALTAHLLAKGLLPRSSKWMDVWSRNRHKFMKAR